MEATAAPERMRTGRPETFESFFEENYERLLRALYLLSGNAHEAEDLAQEAFVKAYERWPSVQTMKNPAGYVYRIALNAHRSRLRRLGVASRRAVARTTPDPLTATDDRDALRRALARLPVGQREAVVLVEWLTLSHEQAADVLRVKPVTVRVRISRAHQALRPILEGTRDE